MIYRILANVPAIILSLFCGAWSDQTGRKLPMMIPSVGSILAVLLYMLSLMIKEHTLMILMFGALVQVSITSLLWLPDLTEKARQRARRSVDEAVLFLRFKISPLRKDKWQDYE